MSTAAAEWTFRIDGMVAEEAEWTWEGFHQLEFEEIPCDIRTERFGPTG